MRLLTAGIMLMAVCLSLLGQNIKNVEGRHQYFLPRHVSRADGEQIAFERAKIAALEKEFGTYVNSETQMNFYSSREGENSEFYSYATSVVKGEWLETTGQVFDIYLTQEGEIVITCDVKGKAREIRRVVYDVDFNVLKGGVTDNCISNNFMDKDNFHVALTAPVDGFVCIYLEDEEKNFLRLLPLDHEGKNARHIKGDERYVFFTSNTDDDSKYQMRTDKPVERNTMHVIFSPHPFVLPVDHAGQGENDINSLDAQRFRKWLDKCRSLDPDMQSLSRPVTITGRQE